MAPYQEGDIISSVELILPKNVIDACHNLRVGVGAEFLATNLKKLTSSRIKLFKQLDESVKLHLQVQALKTRRSDIPEHIFIDKVAGKKGEKEVAAENFCQMASNPSACSANGTQGLPIQSADLNAESVSPSSVALLSSSDQICASSVVLARRPGQSETTDSGDQVQSVDMVPGLVCRDDPLLSSREPIGKGEPSLKTVSSSYVEESQVESKITKVAMGNAAGPNEGLVSTPRGHAVDPVTSVAIPKELLSTDCGTVDCKQKSGTSLKAIEHAAEQEQRTFVVDSHDPCDGNTWQGRETEKTTHNVLTDIPVLDQSGSNHETIAMETEEQGEEEEESMVDKESEDLECTPQKSPQLAKVASPNSTTNRNPPKKRLNYKRERNMECSLCPSMVKDYDSLFDHIKAKHSKAPGYSEIMQDIKELMQVSCDICGKVYSRREQLNVHMANMHQNHAQAKCPECGVVVKSDQHLKGHMRRIHSNAAHKFLCHLCPASFKVKNYLSAHIKNVHSNPIDSFRCDQCGKCCATMKYLHNHKTRVHGAKKFVCKYCSTGFTNQGNLKRHIALVHEKTERAFQCEECGKAFALKNNLKEHVKGVHLKTFNIYCDICKSGFRRRKEYEYHKANVHGQAGAVQLLVKSEQSVTVKNPKPLVSLSQVGSSAAVEACDIQYIVATPEMLEAFNIQVDFGSDS